MGLRPDAMMDRNKACIPQLQIEFLSTVVQPTFAILVQVFPEVSYFLEQIEANKVQWEQLMNLVQCKRQCPA